jgi:NADH-quinone oxidoreductase subunit N
MENMDFLAVSVEVVLTVGALFLLLVDMTAAPDRRQLGVVAGITLLFAGGFAVIQWIEVGDVGPSLYFSNMIALDAYSAFGGLLVIAIAILGLVAAWELVESTAERAGELLVLILLSTAGVHLMAASANFIMLFLALEVASISFYVMAGYTRQRAGADEAGLKYFLLGAFASAVFLYGVALIFAATGTTSMYAVADFFANIVVLRPAILFVGFALVIVGLAFKVTAAPFHMWAPDVYQGAPGGITGFLAAAAKIGGFVALGRVVAVPLAVYVDDWGPIIAALAVVSVVIGTLYAIAQSDIKRMLAYSSVAHAGYILIALVAGVDGLTAMWFYLTVYAFQVIGAFTVAAVVGGSTRGRSALTDYSGLSQRSPVLAGTMALMVMAMAGTPLTAGFVGKVAVFQVGLDAGYLWLVIVGLMSAVAGFFFYLRVVVLMYMQAPALAEAPGAAIAHPEPSPAVRGVLLVCSAVTIAFGLVPWPLLEVVSDAIPL